MRGMLILSLLLNIVILMPICIGLATDRSWITAVYGPNTAARGILLSIYVAIGLVSGLLLIVRDPKLVAALLLVQVVYKLTTPLTVGTLNNPVVISNLAIAAFHIVTLGLIWRTWRQ
ncbi:MAG: hypothetical protein GC179_04980 [Anaerolineaceae bacterium]|nr:hypothetical protein [Anaerolineaceae bacterium]